ITRGSAAAAAAISGPMPAGSPAVMAMRGLGVGPTTATTTAAAAAGATAAGAAAARIVAATLAAAAAVHDTLGVRQLVAEAALEAPAQAGQLGGVQTQILLLGHLDRYR